MILIHYNAGDTRPDDAGWFTARCKCGYEQGPLPDLDMMIDELMGHAYAEGQADVRVEMMREGR